MHPLVSANLALNLEPEPGVEPRSNAYKAIVIAIILFRHGTPGRIRTRIELLRRQMPYPLDYGGVVGPLGFEPRLYCL